MKKCLVQDSGPYFYAGELQPIFCSKQPLGYHSNRGRSGACTNFWRFPNVFFIYKKTLGNSSSYNSIELNETVFFDVEQKNGW